MIKNIVFDLGGVLLEFEPERYLKGLFRDGAMCRQLHEAIFQSELWLELDRGSVTTGEVVTALSRRNPGFQKDIALILSHWDSILIPIEGTVSILEELERAGFKLYALSNFPLAAFEKVCRRYHFFKHFDGFVISSKIGYIKPEPEIYQYLLKKYSLMAEKTLFIDDRPVNLAPAREMGIKTIHFTGPRELGNALTGLGILDWHNNKKNPT